MPFPGTSSPWITLIALIGWILIALGVLGEGISEALAFRADGNIQAFNDWRLADAIRRAGDAKSSANDAADAAASAKASADNANTAASNATVLAKTARQEAESVHEDVVGASTQLADLEQQAVKTKSDLLNLAICNAPRVIPNWTTGGKTTGDPLRSLAGQKVIIEVVPDAEARRAANNLARVLVDAKWDLKLPLRVVNELNDGTSVQPSWTGTGPPANGTLPDASHWFAHLHAEERAEKLVDFLQSYDWQAFLGWPEDTQHRLIVDANVIPEGALRVQIGLYPAVVYVNPPGEQQLTEALEKAQHEREKAKLAREEQLKAWPAELRQKMLVTDAKFEAEWRASMARHTRGPCQVLNPLQ